MPLLALSLPLPLDTLSFPDPPPPSRSYRLLLLPLLHSNKWIQHCHLLFISFAPKSNSWGGTCHWPSSDPMSCPIYQTDGTGVSGFPSRGTLLKEKRLSNRWWKKWQVSPVLVFCWTSQQEDSYRFYVSKCVLKPIALQRQNKKGPLQRQHIKYPKHRLVDHLVPKWKKELRHHELGWTQQLSKTSLTHPSKEMKRIRRISHSLFLPDAMLLLSLSECV